MIPLRPATFLLLIPCFFGCQYAPNAHLLSRKKPSVRDMVGIYVKDKCFVPPGCGTEPDTIRVELRADGSFIATNVPAWMSALPTPDFYASFVSDTGHWRIDRLGTIAPGDHPLWGIYLRDPGGDIHPAEVTRINGKFGLLFSIGDPDAGDGILLKRQ